jgi:hypothetical protein
MTSPVKTPPKLKGKYTYIPFDYDEILLDCPYYYGLIVLKTKKGVNKFSP